MKIKKISFKKSKTIGYTINFKTKYSKVELNYFADLEDGDDDFECTKELSQKIEKVIEYERELIKSKN